MNHPSPPSPSRPTIRLLVFAEGATLAHVARPLALTAALDPEKFSVTFACPPAFRWTLGDYPWPVTDLASQDTAFFMQRLAGGRPLYSRSTLERYIAEDEQLFMQYRPQVVVGDFRLSLSVSARRHGIPYLALSNAYWDPAFQNRMPHPGLPFLSRLPESLADTLFRSLFPCAEYWHCRPMNQIRRRYGMPPVNKLKALYTDADRVAYCDLPGLFTGKTATFADNRTLIGPVLWSPPLPLPHGWSLPDTSDAPDAQRPLIYVTPGSSGNSGRLTDIIRGLTAIDCPGMALAIATAGTPLDPGAVPKNAYVADYLPGHELCRRASLVVCNGGSPTSQQALMAGKPVLGIPHNLDQHMNMQLVEEKGAGIAIRADHLTAKAVGQAASRLLSEAAYSANARQLTANAPSAHEGFARLIMQLAETGGG